MEISISVSITFKKTDTFPHIIYFVVPTAGMKIITQSGSKILPKPSQITGTGGTPVVMVNAGQSTTGGSSGVTMLPRSISSYTGRMCLFMVLV